MARYELSDQQWKQIEDLFPSNEGKVGRPFKDRRTMLNGMLWILRSGAPWSDLPERYGPSSTVHDRFMRWQEDGTFDRICERLQMRLDELGKIDWELFCVDATNVRASRVAAGARKRGTSTTKRRTLTNRRIMRLGIRVGVLQRRSI